MTALIIILGIMACVCNFLMDEVKCKYGRFFGKILPDKWDWWFNPALSHPNKYFSKYPFVRLIFSTILVWTTDFWHFAKTVMLVCVGLIIALIENSTLLWWQYGLEVIALGLGWLLVWELVNGVIGAVSDNLKD